MESHNMWLLSLSIIFSWRFIHVIARISTLLLFMTEWYPIVWYTVFCFYIHQLMDIWVVSSFLTITTNPPVHFYPKIWAVEIWGGTLLPAPLTNPILPWKLASWVCQLCTHTGPGLRRALCSVVAVWKFLVSFEQEAPHFICCALVLISGQSESSLGNTISMSPRPL